MKNINHEEEEEKRKKQWQETQSCRKRWFPQSQMMLHIWNTNKCCHKSPILSLVKELITIKWAVMSDEAVRAALTWPHMSQNWTAPETVTEAWDNGEDFGWVWLRCLCAWRGNLFRHRPAHGSQEPPVHSYAALPVQHLLNHAHNE